MDTDIVLDDAAGSWLSRYIGHPLPDLFRYHLYQDSRNASIVWAYVCPADGHSIWNGEEWLD